MSVYSLRFSLLVAAMFCPYVVLNAQPIPYFMSGDFPGSNPVLVASGVDIGPFTAHFTLDSSGDTATQTTNITVVEATTGVTGLPDTIFEVTTPDTITFSSFVPAASSVFGLDTHVDGVLTFGGPVELNAPLQPFVSGTVVLGVDHPVAGLLTEDGVISELTVIPEPASCVLLGLTGAAALVVLYHNRRRRKGASRTNVTWCQRLACKGVRPAIV